MRANSFNPVRIGWGEHTRWFKDRLDDKNCLFLVAEKDGKFCGQVRFDINPRKDAIINISLKKDIRGLGLASYIINKSISELLRNWDGIKRITAYIKEGNIASCRSFEKADFGFRENMVIKGNRAKVFTKEVSYAAL